MPYYLSLFRRGDQALLEMTEDPDALVKDVQAKFPGSRLHLTSPPLSRAVALSGRERHQWGMRNGVLVAYPGGPLDGELDWFKGPIIPLPKYQVLECHKAGISIPLVMEGDLEANISEILNELPVDDVRMTGCSDTFAGIDEITGRGYPERYYAAMVELDQGTTFIGVTETLQALVEQLWREQGATITELHHVALFQGHEAALEDCRALTRNLVMQGRTPFNEAELLAARKTKGIQ